ncbi:MAG: transglutaminase-like domain-containing protein [Alphaproteobacteria bacterium]
MSDLAASFNKRNQGLEKTPAPELFTTLNSENIDSIDLKKLPPDFQKFLKETEDYPVLKKANAANDLLEKYRNDAPALNKQSQASDLTNIFKRAGEDELIIKHNFLDEFLNLIIIEQVRDFPDKEDLPQKMQDFLKSIETLSPIEKMKKIHEFALNTMTYQVEGNNDIPGGLGGILGKNGKGDCDDYASLEFALLHYAGFKDEDIEFLTGKMKYTANGTQVADAAHAVAIITINGQPYLMDMNMKEPVPLNPNGTAKGLTSAEGGQQGNIPIEVKITPWHILKANGDEVIYPKNISGYSPGLLQPNLF